MRSRPRGRTGGASRGGPRGARAASGHGLGRRHAGRIRSRRSPASSRMAARWAGTWPSNRVSRRTREGSVPVAACVSGRSGPGAGRRLPRHRHGLLHIEGGSGVSGSRRGVAGDDRPGARTFRRAPGRRAGPIRGTAPPPAASGRRCSRGRGAIAPGGSGRTPRRGGRPPSGRSRRCRCRGGRGVGRGGRGAPGGR